jgi:anaerobic magnesium-protoporphyrin IX monomethyl ester cyclase
MTGRMGILVQGFFMFGFPTETEDDLRETVRYCLTSRLDLASFNIVNVFPGTALYDDAVAMGIDLDARSAGYDFDSLDNQLSEVPTARLKRIIQLTNIRFYLHPLRLMRIIQKLPNKRQIADLARYFVQKVFLFLKR